MILRLHSQFYHFKFISRNESNVNKMILPIYFEPYSQKKDIMSIKLLATFLNNLLKLYSSVTTTKTNYVSNR